MQAPPARPKNEMSFSNLAAMQERFGPHAPQYGMRTVLRSQEDIDAVSAGAKKNPDVLTQLVFRAKGEEVREKMAALLENAPNKGSARVVYNIGNAVHGHIARTQENGIWRGKFDAPEPLANTEDVRTTPPKKLLRSILGLVERESVNLKIHSIDGWGTEECALLRSIVDTSKKSGHKLSLRAAKQELLPVLQHILKTGALPVLEPEVDPIPLTLAPVPLPTSTTASVVEPLREEKKGHWLDGVRKWLSGKK